MQCTPSTNSARPFASKQQARSAEPSRTVCTGHHRRLAMEVVGSPVRQAREFATLAEAVKARNQWAAVSIGADARAWDGCGASGSAMDDSGSVAEG